MRKQWIGKNTERCSALGAGSLVGSRKRDKEEKEKEKEEEKEIVARKLMAVLSWETTTFFSLFLIKPTHVQEETQNYTCRAPFAERISTCGVHAFVPMPHVETDTCLHVYIH